MQGDFLKVIHQISNKKEESKCEIWVYCNMKDSPTLIDDVMNALEILFRNYYD